ncbi:DUF5082 domain-containing protein [Bacillus sp. KH172YL63]|uniref:DUF5082 domain-containing protein n=1 Tax=Bacillus sp. KH172YL63 TaxID=2709784 RepID=UPI0013E48FC7|nr:DUF5082 domain-containing protein [Bacillus sp. KH172YL63]BCB06058.1 hypothetical protein KH172YL63_41910 [Bacillus sp. KH172YL63]
MSLFYYYGLLKEKREQLQRLKDCDSKLHRNQQELSGYRKMIESPELSAQTWQGTLANSFNEIRHEGMLHYFNDIEINQFHEVFSILTSKMQQTRSEIESIEHIIQIMQLEEKNSEHQK